MIGMAEKETLKKLYKRDLRRVCRLCCRETGRFGPPVMGSVMLLEETGVPGVKPAILVRVKLGNFLFIFGQSNLNHTTVWSWNRTLVTVARDRCTTTVPPAPREKG